jgi:hypothetical protein
MFQGGIEAKFASFLGGSKPSSSSIREYKKRLSSVRDYLDRARRSLLSLRDHDLPPLQLVRSDRERSDDSIALPDPIEEMVNEIDLLMQKSTVSIGRKKSTVRYAVHHLNHFVNLCNPGLTPGQRDALRQHLFNPVRQRHGHRSRAPNPAPDEMPRYRDYDKAGRHKGSDPVRATLDKKRVNSAPHAAAK